MKVWEANNAALKIWMQATGLKPDSPSILSHMFKGNLYEYHKGIRQAQDVDPTALTTFMILRATVRNYAKDHTFDGLELLEQSDKVLKRTEKLRLLLKILNDEECMAEVAAFQKSLRDRAETMGLLGTVKKVIADVQELAYIRRDALLGFQELKVHHFGTGQRGPHDPKYNENVVKFWNMNSVIAAAQSQPKDGITMLMIRDPVDLFSYFCFLVVNGENITAISDLPETPHPFHKYMSRGRAQERRFDDRAMRLRFPYQLFDFTFSDDGRYTGERQKNTLAAVNTNAVLVKPISQLEPDQALWALMMFDLLSEQYWRQEQRPVELSYTGEGMRQARLTAPGETTKSLALPGEAFLAPLTREDMSREKLAHVFERESTGQNDWLEDRYKHLVPEQTFNLIGQNKLFRLLDGRATKTVKMVPKTQDVGAIFNTNTFGWKNKSWVLSAVEATNFGPPAQMESDRRFVARYNQAIIIEAEATKEFRARKDEVTQWYIAAVKANIEKLLDGVAIDRFDSEVQDYQPRKGDERPMGDFDQGVPQPGDILSQCQSKDCPTWESTVRLYSMTRYKYLCYFTQMEATVWSVFRPMTPKSIADLAGCAAKDLPDVLQHWYRNERYEGNPILDRLDPMDWKVTNPWRSIHFDVTLGLAKSEFNRILRKRGLKRRDFPKKEERRSR